ncbi:MAG: mechanosensitive ion channel domain-containing protein [Pseudomonadota bacterium]
MDFLTIVKVGLQSAIIIGLVAAVVYFIHKRLVALYADRPDQQFQRQMISVALVMTGILVVVLTVPVNDNTRGSLLSLFGIVVSATIALSSTNIVGNIMAGIMLRAVGSFKLGDYISVGDYFGRVSEMDLLHIEIQTEERDLTTLPNRFMVDNPVRVMRNSGTILSVQLSLGYDVSRHRIERLLLDAAEQCGLESPFVQIKELGDFSVTYAIAGLLTDVKSVLGKRRALRAATIDALHADGIEIASPVLVNTRSFSAKQAFVAPDEAPATPRVSGGPDRIVFDKAIEAESIGNLRQRLDGLNEELKTIEQRVSEAPNNAGLKNERDLIVRKVARLTELIERREQKIADE